jgi:acyl carrier protein
MTYEQLLEQAIAEVMGLDAAAVSRTQSFFEQGLDSLAGLRMCRRLGDRIGFEVDIEWVFDHPTIELLAAFLRERALEAGLAPAQAIAAS